MADKKKDEKPKTLKAGGTEHVVKKNKKGDVEELAQGLVSSHRKIFKQMSLRASMSLVAQS